MVTWSGHVGYWICQTNDTLRTGGCFFSFCLPFHDLKRFHSSIKGYKKSQNSAIFSEGAMKIVLLELLRVSKNSNTTNFSLNDNLITFLCVNNTARASLPPMPINSS